MFSADNFELLLVVRRKSERYVSLREVLSHLVLQHFHRGVHLADIEVISHVLHITASAVRACFHGRLQPSERAFPGKQATGGS